MFRIIFLMIALIVVFGAVNARLGAASVGPALRGTLAELAADPARYEGRPVTVDGIVDERVGVLGWGGVRLVDRSGHQILVLGLATPPAPGAPLTVTGTYLTAFALGDMSAPEIVVEHAPIEDAI